MQPAVSDHSHGQAEDGPAPRMGFKRHLRVEVSDGERVYLFSEQGLRVLRGGVVAALAPLLDGSRDVPGLLRDLPAGMSADQVAVVVARLMEAGVVAMRSPAAGTEHDEAALGYWDNAGVDATEAVVRTAGGILGVRAVGDVDGDAATNVLRAAGLGAIPEPVDVAPTTDLSVVLCDDYLHPDLAVVDEVHRKAGRPWLLAKPIGATVWIGPIFQPRSTGCWHCLRRRLSNHRMAETHAQSHLGRLGPARYPAVTVPALRATALHLVALEVTKWLAGHRDPHQCDVWTFGSLDLTGTHHDFRAAPQCATCGDPSLMRQQAWRPVVLTSRARTDHAESGYRALTPKQTYERYKHLISPITGIVKEIRRDERGPALFNVYRSGPNIAARTHDLDAFAATLRRENGGKGVTAEQAQVGALCEAIERYSGHFHGDEETVLGSLRSLGERAIHPNDCQLYHERQYADRAQWNPRHATFQYVSEEFDPNAETHWTPVWSVTERRHRLLPTAMLYYGTPVDRRRMALADSNGNAAGSSLEDAVLQGLLELIERDSVALWWYNRTRMPGVDLDSFIDPWIDELRDVYTGLGRELWVLDVTADLGVPAMAAVSRRIDRPGEQIMFGFGAHLDPRIAVRRALTELNQMMPRLIEPGDPGRVMDDDPDTRDWLRYAAVADHPYVLPDPAVRPRTLEGYDRGPSTDINDGITLIRHRIEAKGMQLLVLDQTRPDTGLPVVKVIVPGLRHFWARFAPGRLYDVPVQLGRLTTPTAYDDLNPLPMFL